MNPDDVKLYNRRHQYTVIYTWFQAGAYFLSFGAAGLLATVYIICPLDGIQCAEWAPKFSCGTFILALFMDTITWLYWKHLINQGAESRTIVPYKVTLRFSDREEFCRAINKQTELLELCPSAMYGYQSGNRNIRIFVFDMPAFHKQEYKKLKSKAVQQAVKKHGMQTKLTRSQMYKAARINLLLVETFTPEAYQSVEINAHYGMNYAEGVLNVIVDLEKKELYIPAYWGTWYGGSAKYCACVKCLLARMPLAEQSCIF